MLYTRQDHLLIKVHLYVREGWPAGISDDLSPICGAGKNSTLRVTWCSGVLGWLSHNSCDMRW